VPWANSPGRHHTATQNSPVIVPPQSFAGVSRTGVFSDTCSVHRAHASCWICHSVWRRTIAVFDELWKQKLTSCAGGLHNMPRPLQVDLWPFDLESGVWVTYDVGYFCANFSIPRFLCSRLKPSVRDWQTSDAHHRLMPPTIGAGA